MFHVPEKYRFNQKGHQLSTDSSFGNNGAFIVPNEFGRVHLQVIASDGENWEHVSVSLPSRCPTWEEMCYIKSLFWDEEDTVVQYHPAKSEYVNVHQYCLHLWRPIGIEFPKPHKDMVG